MTEYLFSEVSQWIPCKAVINQNISFTHLITDSRSVSNPAKALFIAIAGQNHNGHNYISSLYQQGVRCFMVDEDFAIPPQLNEANYLVVPNTLLAFQQMVAQKRSFYTCPVIGITGSNGKTIVKEWIAQLIGKSKVTVRSPRSYNSQIGVPLSVWQLNQDTELGIFEAGISQKEEMEKIAPVISPTIGMITNIGAAHQENFLSEHEKLQEKIKLFEQSKYIVYCSDCITIDRAIKKTYPNKQLFTWGVNASASVQVIRKNTLGNQCHLHLKYRGDEFEIVLPFADEVAFENAMHSIALMLLLGYTAGYITRAVKKLVPVAMRMELKEGINNCMVINDSYNSDLLSLSLSLDFLVQQSEHSNHKRTLILSDIYQSGMDDINLCTQINRLLKQKGISKLIGVGKVLQSHASLFDMDAIFYASTDDLLSALVPGKFKNEAILIKGSRNFEFEKVSSVLEMKHHQTSLEINLNALVDNLNFYRAKLQPHTKLLAMVKAFSYGSGSFEIAKVLQHQKIDYLGVAFADEGVELRKAGISLPIVVMNPEIKSFQLMLQHQLEPEIYSCKELHQFVAVLKSEAISDYPVHLKIDTGMNRLGFVPSQVDELISLLNQMPQVHVKSVFSHLVGSDNMQFDDFTHEQIVAFTHTTDKIEQGLGYPFIRHILNSSGILRFPQAQFDMVRLGIGMYGIGDTALHKLKCVTRFKSYISQIRQVKAYQTIGYNRKGQLNYDADIAVVPVGYADGLNRKLGNGVGAMLVNGHSAPIVGNICMDMCMLDVTGIKANEGDEVEIFGPKLPVTQLARILDTIPYEIFTSISRRVKRVYFYE
ncbi:UDP-N-acetylmuramoyl-tripeptide--D-alanyl-D-alanine ligase [Saccharicrinis carchari]|uniref:Alanine racemase n=1 Tax=Saccharicrinis carchari TaxID=1168039 RepID=A0A521DAY9_SACCC|nr:bifunctional UDP-N-acetylmuramoyl-tripeptide:D-alanyl-D-alanine ligase/alanine racemase [Saccharicrinis carchari]SMO68889.1 UDP-N-acetylmuramoyl-tripeptide--D-alanyl-D-alanine ligase [Saccharicrinis carchari]